MNYRIYYPHSKYKCKIMLEKSDVEGELRNTPGLSGCDVKVKVSGTKSDTGADCSADLDPKYGQFFGVNYRQPGS